MVRTDIGAGPVIGRAAAAGLSGILLATACAHSQESPRLASEASDLFRVIMAVEPPPHRCIFDSEWMNYPVPEEIARKYLGLTIHANLSPPEHGTKLHDILDPGHQNTAAFCDKDEANKYETKQLDAFAKDPSAQVLNMDNTGFAFPVFDADYRRAIVIVATFFRQQLRQKPADPTKTGAIYSVPLNFFIVARIYGKSSDAWRLIATETLVQT